MTFGEACVMTPISLPVFIDNMTPLHLNFAEADDYFIFTENITCETRQPCGQGGWEWLFARLELLECSGGKYVQDVMLYDEAGKIVALARVTYALMPVAMLEGKVQENATTLKSKV